MDQAILKPGDVIGKYEVVRCLGVGGMGEVQLVVHQQLHSYRALKLLRPDLVSRDPVFGERFLREARIASRIQHKNIIQVMDVENDTASGFFYIVMEYVNGNSLQDVLRAGKLSEGQAVHIISEVVNGLAAASELGLVHRDIKPANIMISQEGEVKLADLGIAKAADDDVSMTLTMDNTVVGTPAYSSPEQCSDAHDVDVRADIYSLGATLYEMVTSLPPFSGANTFDTIAHVLADEPVRPRRLNPEISEELEALILRMMAKKREDRPQTIAELQELLKPFRAANADIPPELKSLIHERVEREVQARTSTVITTFRKRQKGERIITLSVLIALLAAGCIFFIYRSGRSQLEIRRWKAEAAKQQNEKKDLALQVSSMKNQMERNRQNYLETIGKLEKTIQDQKSELAQLKNMQSAAKAEPEPAPEKTEPVPEKTEPQSPVLPINIPAAIEERIAHVNTRLQELRQSPKPDTFRQFQIQTRTEQLRRLHSQQQVRDRARAVRQQSSFNEAKTRAVQEKFARHTKERTDWGYNEKDLKFAESLIADLRSDAVDPNLIVTDSSYDRYSGPLIMSVLSGRIQHADRIMAVLLSRYADTAPLAQNKNLLQKTGAGSDAKAAEMILISGGFDSMSEILLPVSSQRPYPKDLIRALLYLDHNVSERDKDGNTALHLAAGAGDQDIVMMLVALDADVNARNRRGETPLFAASRNGHKHIVQLLQKLGADSGLRNAEGKAAADFQATGDFKTAVDRGDIRKIAEILRKKQADPNTVFDDGNTALHIACTKGNAPMIKTLLDAGADPNIRQFHYSRRNALQLALSQPKKIDLDIVDLLLKHGADPNPGFNSWSLLMELCRGNWWVRKLSSQKDQIRLLRLLLSCKKTRQTNVNPYRGGEYSYLGVALSCRRSAAFVSEFLKHIDRLPSGDIILIDAIANDYPEPIVRALIEKGANVNAVQPRFRSQKESRESTTPLWCAVEKKQPAIVKLLLSKGADPQWKNSAGKSITDIQTTPEIRRELR
ncbi:MAG: ankyrin repeat domain-containing protein, partial [Lentisphaeria bacterium]|nr:ankyrin repeat domain-containing protein [Lentisphaeria bacterium]